MRKLKWNDKDIEFISRKYLYVTSYYISKKIYNFINIIISLKKDFICGRVKQVKVQVETLDIDQQVIGDYFNDPAFKQGFQKWVNQLWTNKDRVLKEFNQQG